MDTYLKIKSITPSDSEDIDMYVRGLYVGVGGLVKVTDYYGTTATNIIALQ